MYALPIVILVAGQPTLLDGVLVKLPAELQTTYQLNWYVFQSKKGWNQCPQGFAVYVETDFSGQKYIMPGLLLEGEPRPKKWKIYSNPIFLSRKKVEEFAKSIIQESDRAQREKDQEVRALIHDLRALSANIYHNAESAKVACEGTGYQYAVNRIETVLASQGMLSLRIDMLSLATDGFPIGSSELVPVYKKVDKIVRCFRPNARDRGINLSLQGKSLSQTKGPNNFELIPYAIIDNAMKYAPNNSTIVVLVEETTEEITVIVSSFGPFIEPSERTSIFEVGYRGIHAIKSKQTGTGIGLATAKKLLSHFNGKISVDQDAAVHDIGAASYFMTKFTIQVPKVKAQ